MILSRASTPVLPGLCLLSLVAFATGQQVAVPREVRC